MTPTTEPMAADLDGLEAMSPVPANDPLMIAWEAYKASPDYANTRRWALQEAHVDGSLWAAFVAGFSLARRAVSAPGGGERVWTMHDGKSAHPREPGITVICRDGVERPVETVAAHYAIHDGDRLDVMAWSRLTALGADQ